MLFKDLLYAFVLTFVVMRGIVQDALYINGYFMLFYDLTPDLAASEGHASDSVHGHVRLELKFGKALPDLLVCLLYLEYDGSILIDAIRTATTDF
jgi:hypothetical protein